MSIRRIRWPGRSAWWENHLQRLSEKAKRREPLFDEADYQRAVRQRRGSLAALASA